LSIVLVGDGEPLVETIDQQNYWPGRIVFDDVPLGSFDDYAKASSRTRRPTTLPFRLEPSTR
jgi:hypothetical protein